ncbi:hypothetical protein BDN70DRAFT_887383 [Pholiota conissans]|uniref:WD40 repeat-like protein n=1 Tax=Pholiota conissans TaxID=109636 RepID=A0A9P5YR12_9AGAR|nr:hypothetical protein BDN70DRAFT_887383 [Pholiota conissans]
MPRDLPGLYWDEERNRYFPLSSRPKQQAPQPDTITSLHRKDEKSAATSTSEVETHRRRSFIPLHANGSRLSTRCFTQALRDSHDVLCYHYASTSRVSRVKIPTLGRIQVFRSTQVNGRTWRFIGDEHGWLYSDNLIDHERRQGQHFWSADVNLQHSSAISSISVSGSRCVITCVGPARIAVQDLLSPERMFLLNLHGVSDIRASDIQDRTLVLGSSKKAVYIPDIDTTNSPQYLHTRSDVFSVAQQNHLVYTGARNGTVERFDMRMARHKSQKLFDTRFGSAARSSVLHLSLIRDVEMLLSHLNGDLVTFDMRFFSTTLPTTPVKVFEGHVNTQNANLGITLDEEQDFLFAAGGDHRIRGWSLRTAQPLLGPNADSPHYATNPFSVKFSHLVSALQVAKEPGEAGLSLWAASEQDLYQFHLGQRMREG